MHFDCAGSHKTRNLIQNSCPETSFRELVQRSCQETSYGDLVQRSCQETSYRDLANRGLIEILCRDLARRPLLEILYRDLVKRAAILLRDLRSHTEISHRDLLCISLIERSLQESYQETSSRVILYRDLARTPLMEILHRDIA